MNRLQSRALGCRMMVVLLVLALPGAGVAAPDDKVLQRIELKRRAVQYDEALELAREARQKSRDPDMYVTLSLYEGILLYESYRKDEAREAFLRAFRKQPRAKLPTAVGPQIEKAAESYRQEALAAAPKRDTDKPRKEAKKPSLEASNKDLAARPPTDEGPPLSETQFDDTPAPAPSRLRQHALIPALAGGVLVVAGGISMGAAQEQLNRFKTNDPGISSYAQVLQISQKSRTLQTVGASLLGVGAAGLTTAAVMYLIGGPRAEPPVVGLSTDGASAILYGRWP